ncbi:MAG: potassium efflux system protein [Gammaproteobacteria bacterium]|jgi:CPA2 family monovalent cation:H+ antiporter-2|nr:potassium efflux system protein [Gammaproteobacteria bacterium]
MALGTLHNVLILLLIAVAVVIFFRRLNLPPILGYLLVGTMAGPYGFAWITQSDSTHNLAQFGVVFLMFTIGLEFSLSKLIAMRNVVFGLGSLQVIGTTLITVACAFWLGVPGKHAIVIGGIVAMSSTAIVTKQLTDQLELNTEHGRAALGILLFQDLAVIPFLILIPSLGGEVNTNLFVSLGFAFGKGLIAMLAILAIGRWVLRPVFHEIALSRSMELFTLSVLLVTLGAATLTEDMGLSLALGAFLAGMMLGETEFRHQVEVNIRPFRDVLLGLFFITIGTLLNIRGLSSIWGWVLLLLLTMIIAKCSVTYFICRLLKLPSKSALRTGILLAHGGEFGFAILSLAFATDLLSSTLNQIVLAALVFSMALSPLLIRYNGLLSRFILFSEHNRIDPNETFETVTETAAGLQKHVIICGYGRVGQNIGRILEKQSIEFIALDLDPSRVQNARLAGERVTYGETSNLEILVAAGLKHANALVISFADHAISLKILQQVRKEMPHLPILVRSRDDSDLITLHEHGATEVIPETLEASLALASHLLILMGVPVAKVLRLTRDTRRTRYQLLRQVFPDQQFISLDDTDPDREQLLAVTLPENSGIIGRSLGELQLEQLHVTTTAIRRGGIRGPDPEPDTQLRAGDVLVLAGAHTSLERAEKLLLEGITSAAA